MPILDLGVYQNYFDVGLNKALDRYEERVGEAFPVSVSITCIGDRRFWAFARGGPERLNLDVAIGVMDRVHDVWEKVLALSATLPREQQIALLGHRDHATETSIQWLLQHELNHQAIGHFDLVEGAGLSEGSSPNGLGVVQRANTAPSKLSTMTEEELAELHLCFELQADHDAIEIVLGAYSSRNWSLFRYYAMCILVVVFIIEAEDRQSTEPLRYHPYAATRLFQLIGHLVQLPLIPGIKRAQAEGLDHLPADYLPASDELVAYRAEVVSPIMAASQVIAEACGIPDAWEDVGGAEAFFSDIDTIILNQADHSSDFQTKGAKQWVELRTINARLLKKMGW